ncbi:uncharacterized protein LOC134774628 [Penaeus indicus]|uniref:uncharacterized protein LOC134774628 n=1 Tax=Penaeus indicus TaxID=29960 RepID=UPI00300CD129
MQSGWRNWSNVLRVKRKLVCARRDTRGAAPILELKEQRPGEAERRVMTESVEQQRYWKISRKIEEGRVRCRAGPGHSPPGGRLAGPRRRRPGQPHWPPARCLLSQRLVYHLLVHRLLALFHLRLRSANANDGV